MLKTEIDAGGFPEQTNRMAKRYEDKYTTTNNTLDIIPQKVEKRAHAKSKITWIPLQSLQTRMETTQHESRANSLSGL
jgi:hypothetical protein